MNQQQRAFLIKKIQETTDSNIKRLEATIEQPPSLSNYLFHHIMKGDFEIASIDKLKAMVSEKALNSKGNNQWMDSQNSLTGISNKISFKAEDFFVLPDDYNEKWSAYCKSKEAVKSQIQSIRTQSETLIMRIQLASDKVLQKMVSEIDDMGDLSLMETKIKMIN